MNKRKSYNPFKMWGSYVGLILVLVILIYFSFSTHNVTTLILPTSDCKGLTFNSIFSKEFGYIPFKINNVIDGGFYQPSGEKICIVNITSFDAIFFKYTVNTWDNVISTIFNVTILIVGFFIGWGIHSFFRSLRK